jgi:hypothetical protein
VYCTYMITVDDVGGVCTGLCCLCGECFCMFVFFSSFVQVLCPKQVFRDGVVARWGHR